MWKLVPNDIAPHANLNIVLLDLRLIPFGNDCPASPEARLGACRVVQQLLHDVPIEWARAMTGIGVVLLQKPHTCAKAHFLR